MSPLFQIFNFIPPELKSQHTFIGAVEIGTSKITALVGEYSGRELAIIGRGECQSHGVIKGTIADFKAASDGTQAAMEQAERDAGERFGPPLPRAIALAQAADDDLGAAG